MGEFLEQRQRFFDAVIAATGFSDFGEDDFSQGLNAFLHSLDHETKLSPDGFAATSSQIEALLASRLYSEAGWRNCAKLSANFPRAPLIITGIVRSGTTALHKLLSVDPQFQGLEHWLARAPQPRPPRIRWRDIAAYRKAAGVAEDIIHGAPEMKSDHMMSADEVEESILLLPQTFVSNMFPTQWDIPSYDAWFRTQDETASYARFAKNLQLIGAEEGDRKWLLKNPTDLWSMHALLNVFPDAMIVQTHRDPLQAVPSVSNLIAALRRMFEGPGFDPKAVGRRETEFWAQALERSERALSRTRKPVFDVEFSEFVRDQLGVVKGIYAHFGLGLRQEVERSMKSWLAEHPRRSVALQRFSPEEFGVTRAALCDRYAAYRENRGYA